VPVFTYSLVADDPAFTDRGCSLQQVNK